MVVLLVAGYFMLLGEKSVSILFTSFRKYCIKGRERYNQRKRFYLDRFGFGRLGTPLEI